MREKKAIKFRKKLIVKNPKILGGEEVIANTRITTDRVIFLFKEHKYPPKKIAQEYPQLDQKTVEDVIRAYVS